MVKKSLLCNYAFVFTTFSTSFNTFKFVVYYNNLYFTYSHFNLLIFFFFLPQLFKDILYSILRYMFLLKLFITHLLCLT